ncbi:MAG TPA: DUF2868 domain-containing protein [Usitatibacter sp.]|nr:DUF2868 domain-containing protein [Usitatibacter sp.]
MREEDLRKILLVKAVEETDRDGVLLPPADRATAGREAKREAPDAGEDRLLAARAAQLLPRIAARHSFVTQVLAMLGPSPALTWALVLGGLAVGATLSVLDGSRRINVLAFPLLGIVGWNLAVYVVLLVSALRGARSAPSPLRAGVASLGTSVAQRTIARSRAFNAPLAEALQAFAREWYQAAKPLLLARAARGFHLGAAAVGVGLIAGLYVRGIAFDYQAGWESTFLDATSARRLLAVLYGPAAALTGIPVPDVQQLEAARWRPGGGGGEPAARWIHLMAATALIYVVVPRLLLALAAAMNAMRLAHRVPLPAGLSSYFRTAFATVEGAVPRATAIVMPYSCELPPAALARLIAWLPGVAGGPVNIEARDGIPYGEEERYLESFGTRGGDVADIVVLPFSLATTPEDENHGAVIAGVRDRLAATRPNARVMVVIDEAPYAERMASSPERVAERREAWRVFVKAHGLEPVFVSLAP